MVQGKSQDPKSNGTTLVIAQDFHKKQQSDKNMVGAEMV